MSQPRKPRAYQMGNCPACRRTHRLPLSADPERALCATCFNASMEEPAAKLRAWAEEDRRKRLEGLG